MLNKFGKEIWRAETNLSIICPIKTLEYWNSQKGKKIVKIIKERRLKMLVNLIGVCFSKECSRENTKV